MVFGLAETDGAMNAAYRQLLARFRAIGPNDATNPQQTAEGTRRTPNSRGSGNRDGE